MLKQVACVAKLELLYKEAGEETPIVLVGSNSEASRCLVRSSGVARV